MKVPNHQRFVSSCCNGENNCWKAMELGMSGIRVGMLERVVMVMEPPEGIARKESVEWFRLQKTLKKNKLMAKSWTRDSNDCGGGN